MPFTILCEHPREMAFSDFAEDHGSAGGNQQSMTIRSTFHPQSNEPAAPSTP